MDCKTARLLLEFARPQHAELDPPDLRDLEAHVAACPDCTLNAKQERAFDEQLGQAMRNVEVPDRLRARLLGRLAADRAAARKWRWKALVGGAIAAAAVLLLAIGGWALWHEATLKPLDIVNIEKTEIEKRQAPPGPQDIEADFRRQDIKMTAPTSMNYAFLAFHGLGELQEHQVPVLIFIRRDVEANVYADATVYVVSERDFNLKNVPQKYQPQPGYSCKVEVYREKGSSNVYVIVYSGEDFGWLLK